MSIGHNARLSQLLALHQSGELEAARLASRTRKECAARLGMSEKALAHAIIRARALGHDVPRWSDARHIVPANDGCGDFADEEPTVRCAAELPETGQSAEQQPESGRSRYAVREPFTRHLTRDDVPDGSVVAVLSDIHIPYHDADAVRLAIECCERAGATHVILNGDIADCGPSSRHEAKRRREILQWGTTRASVEPGLWIYEWARTKRCFLLRGNHEGWVENEIKESSTANGSSPEHLMGLPEDGDGWEVLPDMSRLRLGSRVWCHGSNFFKTGSPGQNPGARLKSKAPDQTTSVGHCHIKHASFWTTEDEYGINRTRAAFFNGHLSRPEAHGEYAGTNLQWQQSFEITRVWWLDDRPRFTTDQPEIHRDRYGRPIFEYGGKIFGGRR